MPSTAWRPTAEGPAFKARVRAVPSEGEANAAVEKLVGGLARRPEKPRRRYGGGKSRVKSLKVSGRGSRYWRQRLQGRLRC